MSELRPYSNRRYAIADWLSSCLPTDGNFWFVTLSLKQGIERNDGMVAYLNQEAADNNVRWFLKQVNRAVYGNAARKYGKKLQVVDATEGGAGTGKRLHRHLTIEKPSHLTGNQFAVLLRDTWLRSSWGYDKMSIEPAHNHHAVLRYITKTGGDAVCLTNTSL